MDGASEHLKGMQYEKLIKRAFSCPEGDKHGARAGYFQNLYRAERGEKPGLLAGSFQDQFREVKQNIRKALRELGTGPDFKNKGFFMGVLTVELDQCERVDCLAKIVVKALEKLN